MSHEEFVAKVRANNPNFRVIGTYVNNKTKVLIKCLVCGQEYAVDPSSVLGGVGCPYCAGQKAIPGVNDLETCCPDIAQQWDYEKNGDLTPRDVKPRSNKKVWWKCGVCGGSWQAAPATRYVGRGCPYCSGNRVLPGFNDLATRHPELCAEWNYEKNGSLKPTNVTPGSNKKVWWQCKRGHEWKATISTRVHGAGCPYCAGNLVIPGETDLATRYPEIAAKWNYQHNGNLKPSMVMPGSHKKVWWKGDCGHEWDMPINSMVKNDSCPYCSGKRILAGFNDLATVNPGLAAEWHPTKNGELRPTMVTANSNKRVWWRCEKGHEWQQSVAIRNGRGNGCPYCNNSKALPGYNDLATTHPELAEEWAYDLNGDLKPTDFTYGSERKVWWRCRKCGHVWQTTINLRTTKAGATGCPNCAAPRGTSFPEQALLFFLRRELDYEVESRAHVEMAGKIKELDVWIPSLRIGYEYDGEYSHSIRQRHDNEKDELARRAGIRLIRVIESNHKDYADDHITFDVRHQKRKNQQDAIAQAISLVAPDHGPIDLDSDTPAIMAQYKGEEQAHSLAARFPKIAAEWNYERNAGLIPEKISYGSEQKVWWRCPNAHEYQASVSNRTRNGSGCPICANRQALAGFNDLATLRPDLAAEWHPTKNGELTPEDVVCNSHKKVWWLCPKCGYEWKTTVSSRTGRHTGCPACAGRVVVPGINDLATENPEIAAEWHPTKNGKLKPTMVTPNSSKRVWWIGKCGHEWEATVAGRSNGRNCPYCRHQKVLKGFNDLQTLYPNVAKEWHPTKNAPLTPSDVMPKSGKKRWWKCSRCGNEYQCVVHNMTYGVSGCRKCGYKPGLQN